MNLFVSAIFRGFLRMRVILSKKIQVRFYYDILDIDRFVILPYTLSLFRELNKPKPYVNRSWFLDNYKNAVQCLGITNRSCLVEFLLSKTASPQELRRFQLR